MDAMADKTLADLKKAADGLLFPSETDAPFDAFVWDKGANSAATIAKLAGEPAKTPHRSLSLADFLQDLNDEPEFKALLTTLEALLTGITVHRFGTDEPHYYIVGTDADGKLAGLKTEAVET